jgi:rare lipoprotein A
MQTKVRAAIWNLVAELSLLGGITIAIAIAGCVSHAPAVVGPMVCTLPHDEILTHPGAAIPGQPDLSGSTRVGKASFYARSFANRLMADGRRMNPRGDNAASRTLPLGTTAKVINVQTGQSAIVLIEDRGPYVAGRIVDLSPATAQRIGITRRIGVAKVKVAPIAVWLPNGGMKRGSGAPRTPICRISSA